ncbi:MAG: ABC transporter ATP-binding protein, partial [Bacteroidetes bacterium]
AFEGIKDKANLVSEGGELKLRVKSPRLGGKIMDLDQISKHYGALKLINSFSYKFAKGERLGIIGRNGTGKTTFLNALTGIEPLDSGTIQTGETVVLGYYRQMGQKWKKELRVIDAVREIAEVVAMEDGRSISASQFLEHFMFSPDSQYKRISKLSGGELRRLHLLSVLIKNPNFLILDEPTNDLDLFALNKLEEFLRSFKGCLVIVSHDRYFLDKLTDHLFIFEGEGNIKDQYGRYSEYRQQLDSEKKLAQKNSHTSVRNPTVPKGNTKPEKQKSRLTYKEQLEYLRLEPEIEELEKEKAILEEDLNSGTLEYQLLIQKSARIAELIQLIDKKIQRWMELGQFVT